MVADPNKERAEFFRRAKIGRYEWAKQVDPQAVIAFERRANERRAKKKND